MIDPETKKTVLRMIPYGVFVLTACATEERIAAAGVNWLTQIAFKPPMVAVAVRQDSGAHALIQEMGAFALNALGKSQAATAFAFFKPTVREGMRLSGEPFHFGETGAPVLESALGWFECRVSGSLPAGDHTLFTAEVVAVGLKEPLDGRPDDAVLTLRDLGANIFYGG